MCNVNIRRVRRERDKSGGPLREGPMRLALRFRGVEIGFCEGSEKNEWEGEEDGQLNGCKKIVGFGCGGRDLVLWKASARNPVRDRQEGVLVTRGAISWRHCARLLRGHQVWKFLELRSLHSGARSDRKFHLPLCPSFLKENSSFSLLSPSSPLLLLVEEISVERKRDM